MRKNTISRYVGAIATSVGVTVIGVVMVGAGALAAPDAADFRLLDAAKSEDAQAIRSLVDHGAAVNVKRADGVTPLHWAAQANDLASADLLIHAGAEVNAADN